MYGILVRYGITVRYFIGSTEYGKLSRTVLNPRTSVDITRNFFTDVELRHKGIRTNKAHNRNNAPKH